MEVRLDMLTRESVGFVKSSVFHRFIMQDYIVQQVYLEAMKP